MTCQFVAEDVEKKEAGLGRGINPWSFLATYRSLLESSMTDSSVQMLETSF